MAISETSTWVRSGFNAPTPNPAPPMFRVRSGVNETPVCNSDCFLADISLGFENRSVACRLSFWQPQELVREMRWTYCKLARRERRIATRYGAADEDKKMDCDDGVKGSP